MVLTVTLNLYPHRTSGKYACVIKKHCCGNIVYHFVTLPIKRFCQKQFALTKLKVFLRNSRYLLFLCYEIYGTKSIKYCLYMPNQESKVYRAGNAWGN